MGLNQIHPNLDKKTYSDLHKVMGMKLIDDNGVTRIQIHKGSKNSFYVKVIQEGLNIILNEYEKKVKDMQNGSV